MKKTIFSTIVIAIIATVTSRVWALERGGLTVYSEFNEPFYAEMALLQAHGTLEEGLHVGLASEVSSPEQRWPVRHFWQTSALLLNQPRTLVGSCLCPGSLSRTGFSVYSRSALV